MSIVFLIQVIRFDFFTYSFDLIFLDVTSNGCFARGCTYDAVAGSTDPSCYVPPEKGGYAISSVEQISDTITQYNLVRLSERPILVPASKLNLTYRVKPRQPPSNLEELIAPDPNQFSIYGHDIDHLNAQVSVSGTDMIRLTIRDAEKDRYEVPVPIQWQPSAIPSSITTAKIQFEMTKTSNGQAGFRVRRTATQSVIFDTSYFAHGFIYDNQYIQFITTIPSTNVYGKVINDSSYHIYIVEF